MTPNRKIGLELRHGHDVGRDPRRMTGDELVALGHRRMGPLKALRLRCIDCSGGSAPEVRLCTAVQCPAWPFRMGRNPWRAPASDERRARARATMVATRAFLAADPGQEPGPDELQRGAATTLATDIRADETTPALAAKREDCA
jgi:hypothetical protein